MSKMSPAMAAKWMKISAMELFRVYASTCSSEGRDWENLTTQQQRGWIALADHIASLADVIKQHGL